MSQNYVYPTSSTVSLTGSPNNAPIPSTSILVAGENSLGNQTVLQQDASGSLLVDIASASSGPLDVNVVASVLPTGASTATLQTTGNTSLASIDGKTATLGQKNMAGSEPVVIASDQSTLPVSAAALPLPSGASTSALQTQISGQLPTTLGTKLVTTSLAVNIASDQIVPVSASALPLPSGASTSALQTTGNTALSAIQTSVGSIDVKTPALGQALAASSVPVVLTAAQISTLTPLTAVTVTQATGTNLHTVVDSGTLVVTQTTGTNLHTVVDSGTINARASTPTAGTITQAALTIGTSAIRLTVSGNAPSSTRSVLVFTPDSSSTAKFYIGSSSVTTTGSTRGIQLLAGQVFTANNDAADYYVISDATTQTGYVMEQA